MECKIHIAQFKGLDEHLKPNIIDNAIPLSPKHLPTIRTKFNLQVEAKEVPQPKKPKLILDNKQPKSVKVMITIPLHKDSSTLSDSDCIDLASKVLSEEQTARKESEASVKKMKR